MLPPPFALVLGAAFLAAGCGSPRGGTVAEHAPFDSSSVIRGLSLSVADGDAFDPRRAGSAFPSGSRGVAARYRFEHAGAGTRVELRWMHQGQLIFGQEEELNEPSGTNTWVLRMGKGSPLPDGSYALEVRENGKPVLALPFSIGSTVVEGGSPPSAGPATAPAPGRGPAPGEGAGFEGNEPGERVTGLAYRDDSARFAFAVPSYAWRFDPVSQREPENAVVAGRFSPSGSGLALLRVRVFPGAGELEEWAAERQRATGADWQVLKAERREIGGREFVQVEARAPGARVLAAYTVEGATGYAFEFRSEEPSFATLEDEFQEILGSARFW